jgi:Guanyl-specific ribonuclease Sa
VLRAGLVLLLVALHIPAQAASQYQNTSDYQSRYAGETSQFINAAELPVEARAALQAIKQGGPFAYSRDGVVFNNFERKLKQRPRGYYHEYTVKTPGVHNRGTRRIISGAAHEYYYTADHYQTFKRIRE